MTQLKELERREFQINGNGSDITLRMVVFANNTINSTSTGVICKLYLKRFNGVELVDDGQLFHQWEDIIDNDGQIEHRIVTGLVASFITFKNVSIRPDIGFVVRLKGDEVMIQTPKYPVFICKVGDRVTTFAGINYIDKNMAYQFLNSK